MAVIMRIHGAELNIQGQRPSLPSEGFMMYSANEKQVPSAVMLIRSLYEQLSAV